MQRRIKKLPAKTRPEFSESIHIARLEVARLDHIITQFLRAIRPQPLTTQMGDVNVVIEDRWPFSRPNSKIETSSLNWNSTDRCVD